MLEPLGLRFGCWSFARSRGRGKRHRPTKTHQERRTRSARPSGPSSMPPRSHYSSDWSSRYRSRMEGRFHRAPLMGIDRSGTAACISCIPILACHYNVCALPPDQNRLQVSLVETRRTGGRVHHEHIASLGSVEILPSVFARLAFWQRLHERLAKLSNRIDAATQGRVLGNIQNPAPKSR